MNPLPQMSVNQLSTGLKCITTLQESTKIGEQVTATVDLSANELDTALKSGEASRKKTIEPPLQSGYNKQGENKTDICDVQHGTVTKEQYNIGMQIHEC